MHLVQLRPVNEMTIKFNRQNTDFQIAYFIAGSCHTPDAAYFALLNLKQERQSAVDTIPATTLRLRAERIKAERQCQSKDLVEQLTGQADLIVIDRNERMTESLNASARAELAFIDQCIEKIQPMRRYNHLSDIEAAEAMQSEEWCYELERRAENFLLTNGTIPHDHFNTMRQHPAFNTHLLPHIDRVHQAIQNGTAPKVLLASRPRFDLPAALGFKNEMLLEDISSSEMTPQSLEHETAQ